MVYIFLTKFFSQREKRFHAINNIKSKTTIALKDYFTKSFSHFVRRVKTKQFIISQVIIIQIQYNKFIITIKYVIILSRDYICQFYCQTTCRNKKKIDKRGEKRKEGRITWNRIDHQLSRGLSIKQPTTVVLYQR